MLKKLVLENFRSYQKYLLDFEMLTVLIGKNGIGKTNILESISLISCGRSFRESDRSSLVNYHSDFARATAEIVGENEAFTLEIFISKVPRLIVKAKENGVPRKISDFIGKLPSVVFSPETIEIITGAPAERRRFLDIMLSQVDHEYLRALMDYSKTKRQRNSLLQRIGRGEADVHELDFWDSELVSSGKIIETKREQAIEFFSKIVLENYRTISADEAAGLQVKYIRKNSGDLLEDLCNSREREIAYGGTIYGPHRDDLQFVLNGRNMANFASRGELRSAILATKIAELKFIEKIREKSPDKFEIKVKPILLLDDVFSEFDEFRRTHLGEIISNYQTIITTTDREYLSRELVEKVKIVELNS